MYGKNKKVYKLKYYKYTEKQSYTEKRSYNEDIMSVS